MKVRKQVKEELANTRIYTFKGIAERNTYSCQALQNVDSYNAIGFDTGMAISDLKKNNFGRHGRDMVETELK